MSQSFLTDRTRLERIAEAAVPGAGWSVVEIGPGTGALTEPLARRAARLLALEADGALAAATAASFADRPSVRIEHADALEFDFGTTAPSLAASGPGGVAGGSLVLSRPLAVVGNIPYHLTGLILRTVLDADPRPDRVVFLVQREVAGRLIAAPGGREYGALTALVGVAWSVRRLFKVPAGAFHPPPKVDSAVLLFEPLEPPLCPPAWRPAFRRVVMAAFEHRRQTLRNALRHGGLSDAELAAVAAAPGVRLDRRPEEHPIAAYVEMARVVWGILPHAATGPQKSP
ncbi:MAG: ribosomal RNA small subunit methyltransferase A [Acidobacteria bacterium]|nr:ribosomal RNA small subunit methyltransferase A [Acidobacteriota bacterium]